MLFREFFKMRSKGGNTRNLQEKSSYMNVKFCAIVPECSVNFLAEEEDRFTVSPSSLSDALDLLETSDNRIGLLLAEVTCYFF